MSSRWFHLMSWDVWESVSPQYSGTFHTLYVCVLQFGERDYIQTIVQSVAHRQRKSALIPETHDNNTTTMISESDVTYGQAMLTHTRNLCSAFNLFKCTHTVNTHTPWTHTWSSGHCSHLLEVRWLAQGHLVVVVHSVPPPTIPAGPRLELATFGLRVWLSNH